MIGTLEAFKTLTATFKTVVQNGNNVIAIESKRAWLEICEQDIEMRSSLMHNSHRNNSMLLVDIVSLTHCRIQQPSNRDT